MKSLNFSINVVLVGLSSVFEVCFGLVIVLVGNHPMKMAKNAHFCIVFRLFA